HQWRQPLNALNINIQLLEDDYEDNLIDGQYLNEFIKKQTDTVLHLSHTIDDFRNFFKKDKEKKHMDIKSTIEAVKQLLHAQLKSNGIEVEIEGENFEIDGFENELKQAMINIITNSKDAILDKKIKEGKIQIKIDAKAKKIYLCDNGGGINTKVLQRVFEPYFTTKETNKGTGIGLYMTKLIVEDHMKGKVDIYNQNNGICVELGL
ncbi:MAG: sensor histidine kinase, partial [Campylobacterota bacterium]